VLSGRNGRVGQVAAHVGVSLSKDAHGVRSVADAETEARTQPKIVANVVKRSSLIAPLEGVERDDGRVR